MQHVVHFVVHFVLVVLGSVVNFVAQFYLRSRENKFCIVIYSRVHFAMRYIFKFYIFAFLHSRVYFPSCLFESQ